MTIIHYDGVKNIHPQGLVGYRVARTLGSDKERKENFFSHSVYGQERARQLAEAKELELRAIAEKNRKANRLKRKGPLNIATGLRAIIKLERKNRGGEKRTYFTPAFEVTLPDGKYKVFRTQKYGYEDAWRLAVDFYSETYGLTQPDQEKLLKRRPGKCVFLEDLRLHVRAKGHRITKPQIMEKLKVG